MAKENELTAEIEKLKEEFSELEKASSELKKELGVRDDSLDTHKTETETLKQQCEKYVIHYHFINPRSTMCAQNKTKRPPCSLRDWS